MCMLAYYNIRIVSSSSHQLSKKILCSEQERQREKMITEEINSPSSKIWRLFTKTKSNKIHSQFKAVLWKKVIIILNLN